MTHKPRYTVIYRDSPDDRIRYFGPFVSDLVADNFLNKLPKPLAGGFKTYKAFSPYTMDEASLASEVILRRRKGSDYLFDLNKTIREIAQVFTP